jgi:hypothetical protein
MPKDPRSIVYHKQSSIQHKDPFQTEKLENKAGDIIEKYTLKYLNDVKKRLSDDTISQ